MRQYLIIAERDDITYLYLQEAKTNARARWAFIDYVEKRAFGPFKRITAIVVPLGKPTSFLASLPAGSGVGRE